MSELKFNWQYPSKLQSALTFKDRYLILEGGRFSGKSHFLARKCLQDCMMEKADLLCVREYQDSLKESNYKLLKSLINKYNLPYKVYSDRLVSQTKHKSEIVFIGMNNLTAENIKSFEGFKRAWVEEAQNFSVSSMELLDPTIRQDGSQLYFSMNRKRTKGDIIQHITETFPGQYLRTHINYMDNPFVSGDMIKQAEAYKLNKPDEYQIIYLGVPNDDFNAKVVKYFNDENIKTVNYSPDLTMHITCDFNVDPCYWIIAHKGVNKVFFFDEICLENTTVRQMTQEFIRRYGEHKNKIIVNGDASGDNRSAGSEYSFYAQMLNELRRHYGYDNVEVKIKKSNPLIQNRILAWNDMVYTYNGERNILINPRCKWLLYNMNELNYKEGTSSFDLPSHNQIKSDKNKKFLCHPFDAASYMVDYYWGIKVDYPDVNTPPLINRFDKFYKDMDKK